MNKQKKYGIIGIILIVVLIIIWIAVSNSKKDTIVENNDTMNHEDRNHENINQNENDSKQNSSNETIEKYLEEQNIIMTTMMEDMENINKSENASIDFLVGMIPHHESAISMAESYLKYSEENEELKQIAENIIQLQKKEIEQMKSMIKDLETNGTKDAAKEESYLKEYNDMFSQHHMNHISSDSYSSVSEAFADGMIMHHQMAIDMSKAILNHSDDETIKKFAQDIIDVQEKEISQMQDILNTLKNS